MDAPKRDDQSIQGVNDIARSDIVRRSHLAIVACALSLLSWVLLPGLRYAFIAGHDYELLPVWHVYLWVAFIVSILAIVLGPVSIARIALSGGRLTGWGFAWTSAGLMAAQVFLVLVPAFARTRCVAFRMTCGTNLAGIGKAMLIYANDYDDELPKAGGRTTVWGQMPATGWIAPSRMAAYGTDPSGLGGTAGITSCLYLLVKYAEVTPKSFICTDDTATTEFKLSGYYRVVPRGYELINLWDFGPPAEAYKHCSYSYHIPFGQYALTTSNEAGLPVAADRNPWIAGPATTPGDIAERWSRFKPDVTGPGVTAAGTSEQARQGNGVTHRFDGQNVLFLDSHVEFAKRAFAGLDDDNIYTVSTLPDRGDLWGMMPVPGPSCRPANRRDSVLVNDPPGLGTGSPAGGPGR